MKNRILFAFLAIALVVSLAAFAACATEEEGVVTEGWQWPEKLMIGTAGVGDQNYVVSIAWSTPLGEDTGMTTRVVVQPDMYLRYIWLRTGVIDVTSLKQSGRPWIETGKAEASRDGGPSQLRGFGVAGKRDSGWATRGDTGIKTPFDIKPGTKIIYPAYLGPLEQAESQQGLIAWAQVSQEDIEWIPGASKSATHQLLMEGKGDIAYAENVVSSAWYEAEAGPRGLSWLDVDSAANPEAATRYANAHPEVTFAVISNGVPSALGHYGMTSMGPYLVMDTQDPELVYNIQKWFVENYDSYKDNHPILAGFTLDNVMTLAKEHYIPIHEGGVRYLKEVGLWTPATEARRQFNIDTINKYMELYSAALLDADTKGIEVNPKNKEWIDLWFSYKDTIPNLSKLRFTTTSPTE